MKSTLNNLDNGGLEEDIWKMSNGHEDRAWTLG